MPERVGGSSSRFQSALWVLTLQLIIEGTTWSAMGLVPAKPCLALWFSLIYNPEELMAGRVRLARSGCRNHVVGKKDFTASRRTQYKLVSCPWYYLASLAGRKCLDGRLGCTYRHQQMVWLPGNSFGEVAGSMNVAVSSLWKFLLLAFLPSMKNEQVWSRPQPKPLSFIIPLAQREQPTKPC
jgi:hypothetical protein